MTTGTMVQLGEATYAFVEQIAGSFVLLRIVQGNGNKAVMITLRDGDARKLANLIRAGE